MSFDFQARAVVDYLPSPYDRDALRFSKAIWQKKITHNNLINAFRDGFMTMMVCLQDDIIDIIAMNASGLWRGACAGRVGNFKFVDSQIFWKLSKKIIFGLMWSFLKTCSFRFVNVEILPPRERRRSRSRSLRRVKRRPRTIAEVMRVDYKTTWW